MNTEITFDDIYGINIDEYCKIHEITLDDLIKSVTIDIELLQKNFKKEVFDKELKHFELTQAIHNSIEKKRRHLKRLKKLKESRK